MHQFTLVPLKLNLQNNKARYEIAFDFNIKRDKADSVAKEL